MELLTNNSLRPGYGGGGIKSVGILVHNVRGRCDYSVKVFISFVSLSPPL